MNHNAKRLGVFLLTLILVIGTLTVSINKQSVQEHLPVQPQLSPQKTPAIPNISTVIPAFMQYPEIVTQLKKWNQEAQDLTEVRTYGKTSQGQDIYFIRITNKLDQSIKKKVLITASIHGNEPLSSSTIMAYIGTMLANYSKDPQVTELINTREIFFSPVISPDSYPNSRQVNGIDPNRDFPGPTRPNHNSIPAIKAIQNLFQQQKFSAVISGHTSGRVLLSPYGDKMTRCPNESDFQKIVGQMASMAGYRHIHACEVYGRPIHGSEIDWFLRNGAFAIVCEFGTHQKIPSLNDTRIELDKTYKATLHFIKEAPLVNIISEAHVYESQTKSVIQTAWLYHPTLNTKHSPGDPLWPFFYHLTNWHLQFRPYFLNNNLE